MSGAILVTGATGKTGGGVLRGLHALRLPIRSTGRTSGDVRFEWTDPSTYDEVSRGVSRVYLVAPPLESDASLVMIPFVEHALRAGARRVVLLSSLAIDAGDPGLGTIERILRDRAPEWAVVKPSWFMQNFVGRWHPHGTSLLDDGVVVTSTGNGRVGFVDV